MTPYWIDALDLFPCRRRYCEDKQLNTLIHLHPSALAHTAVPAGELMALSSYFNYEKKHIRECKLC